MRTQNARTSLKSQELKIALFAAAGGENRVVLLCCGNSLPHPHGFVNGFLIFHGDRAALAPAGVEIGLVHRLIGTHPHIVFLALGELGNGLGGGLGALYSHGLVAFLKFLSVLYCTW